MPHNSIAACLARSRSGLRVGCGVVAWVATAIKPFQKILFDDRKLRAAGRIDVLISDDVEFSRLKRLANDHRRFFTACIKALAN